MRPLARKKRVKEYFLPFLIIVGAGFGIIFLIQFYLGWTQGPQLNEAEVFVVDGQAKIQSWGAHEWHTTNNIDRLLSGDKIRTSRNARVVLRFYDDAELRMAADTQLTVEEIFTEEEGRHVAAAISMGDLWIEKADLLLTMNDLRFQTDEKDVVEVEQKQSGAIVRVMKGELDIDVLKFSDTDISVVDTVIIKEGQEAIFANEDLVAFREYHRPYVEYEITEEFLDSEWYLWNKNLPEHEDFAYLVDAEFKQDEFLDLDPPVKPVVISPPNFGEKEEYQFTGETLTLTGTVSEDTAKMKVVYSVGSVLETHNLLQFKSGSGKWSYNISERRGNLLPGVNNYQIYALDELSNESEPLTIKVAFGEAVEDQMEEETATPQVKVN